MKAHALHRIPLSTSIALVIASCLIGAAPQSANGEESKAPPFAPARGHYAKLGQLDPKPAGPDLPIDAQRWNTKQSSIDRIEKIEPEFVRVPLETFTLPPCPANSSKQTRAEIDYLLRLQANRTDEEGKRGLYFASWGYSSSVKPDSPDFPIQQRNIFYVGRSIGSWFNPKDLPVTTEVVGRVWRDASYYMWRLKFKNARIRPYQIDSSVKSLEEPNWAAFPSGHASFSHMLAYLFSELAPEFSDIFLNDARGIAHSREIIGVHFPSDSEAGRVFGRQFVEQLLKSEKFRPEFEKMKAEWQRVRAASPD